MQKEYPVPDEVRAISRHMKVIHLGYVAETGDPWAELTGMFSIGREIDAEDLIKKRWTEHDEGLGF